MCAGRVWGGGGQKNEPFPLVQGAERGRRVNTLSEGPEGLHIFTCYSCAPPPLALFLQVWCLWVAHLPPAAAAGPAGAEASETRGERAA